MGLQQIIVDLAVLAAALFLARGMYRSVISSRRAKAPTCSGCGSCEAAKTGAPASTQRSSAPNDA